MEKLTVVGIGPGDYDNMTVRADRALAESEVIIGYGVYIDLVRDRYPDKEFLSTPMTREADRCRMALESARSGKRTAMVCLCKGSSFFTNIYSFYLLIEFRHLRRADEPMC